MESTLLTSLYVSVTFPIRYLLEAKLKKKSPENFFFNVIWDV